MSHLNFDPSNQVCFKSLTSSILYHTSCTKVYKLTSWGEGWLAAGSALDVSLISLLLEVWLGYGWGGLLLLEVASSCAWKYMYISLHNIVWYRGRGALGLSLPPTPSWLCHNLYNFHPIIIMVWGFHLVTSMTTIVQYSHCIYFQESSFKYMQTVQSI